ncbi:hypothetical protein [Kitasatospora sp. NPDC056731]
MSIVRGAAVDAVIDGSEEITEQALRRHTHRPALGPSAAHTGKDHVQ